LVKAGNTVTPIEENALLGIERAKTLREVLIDHREQVDAIPGR
jgi:hypothetical protein